jgi:hypothetical protein
MPPCIRFLCQSRTGTAGASGLPVFPAPSLIGGFEVKRSMHNSGEQAARPMSHVCSHTPAVIARAGGRSSIPQAVMIKPHRRSVLDSPPEPVIGLTEGETRWRGMTPRVGKHIERRSSAAHPTRHCEARSDEAIQTAAADRLWIASLPLAMTMLRQQCPLPPLRAPAAAQQRCTLPRVRDTRARRRDTRARMNVRHRHLSPPPRIRPGQPIPG